MLYIYKIILLTTRSKPEPPKQGCLILDDATEEAIGEALYNNPRGINIISDEVASFICGMGRYNGAKESSKTRLISCLDGSLWKNSRKGKKACIVPNALLSLLGGVQPKRFKEIFTEDFFDSGLAQRVTFIRAVREKPAKWKRAKISDREEEELLALIEYLYALEFDTSPDGQLIPFKIQLSDEAETVIGEYYDRVSEEAFLAQTSDAESSRLTKSFTKLSAVALLLHILDCYFAGNDDYRVRISADVIRRAIRFNTWANEHEKQLYQYCEAQNAKAVTPPDLALMKAIIQLAECGQYVQQSDGSKFFANSDMLEAVNRELKKLGGAYTPDTLARNQLLKSCTPIRINRHTRGRKIPDELLAKYKLTVSTVSTVSNRCGTRVCGERHSKNNCLQVSPEEQGMIQDGRHWRQSENSVSPLKTVAAQGLETLETVETLNSDFLEF